MDSIILNKKNIKTISGIVNFFYNLKENEILFEGTPDNLFKLLNITDTKVNYEILLGVFKRYNKNIRSLIKYIENNNKDLDLNRMIDYVEYKTQNPSDANSEKFLKLMYGNEIGINKFQKIKNNFSKFYDKNYYIGLGLSEDDAKLKIEEFKKNKATNLKNFIKKYGNELGVEKYSQYVNDSKNTITNFKKRYGDNWNEKWNNYIKKDSSSINWALKKANGDVLLSKKIFFEKNKKTTITLDYLTEKYGKDVGEKKWEELTLKKDSSSIDYFLSKYQDVDLAIEKYNELNNKKDSSSLKFFIKKYGDEGVKKYEEKCKLSDNKSLSFFTEKYGDYETAYKYYIEEQKKIKVKALRASKESLKYFKPIYDFLLRNGLFEKEDIFLGIDGSKEFFLSNKNGIFFYDFVIKSKKIIIEFNGKSWHPNWEKYGEIECVNKFKDKYKTIDPIKSLNKDLIKIKTAKENGFEILVIWEEDDFLTNIEKIINFLKQKNIHYEN